MNTRLVLALAALLAPTSALASVTNTGPIGGTHTTSQPAGTSSGNASGGAPASVLFDGQALDADDLQADFATTGLIQGFDACDSGDGCSIWFTELASIENRLSEVAWPLRVTMLTEEACTAGDACLNGYLVARRIDADIVMDLWENELRGSMESYVGYTRRGVSAPTVLEHLGWVDWTESPSGASEYHAYLPDGSYAGGLVTTPSSGNAAVDVCDAISGGVVDFVASGAGAVAAFGTVAAVGSAFGILDAAAASTGAGAPFAAGAAPGQVLMTLGAGVAAGIAVKGLVSGVATFFGTDQICSTLLDSPEDVEISGGTQDQIGVNGAYETANGSTCPSGARNSICESCAPTDIYVWSDPTSSEEDGVDMEQEGDWVTVEQCHYVDCCVPY